MTNINPINLTTNVNPYYKKDVTEDSNKNSEKNTKAEQNKQKQIDANNVLGFMAAKNADIIPNKATKTVEVSKYVSKDQETRIADFMKGFEEDYNKAFDIAANEFPDISDETAGNLALAYINATY